MTLTFTITDSFLYLMGVLILMALQVYQQFQIRKLHKEVDSIWTQIGTIAHSISVKMLEMQKDIVTKEDKK